MWSGVKWKKHSLSNSDLRFQEFGPQVQQEVMCVVREEQLSEGLGVERAPDRGWVTGICCDSLKGVLVFSFHSQMGQLAPLL